MISKEFDLDEANSYCGLEEGHEFNNNPNSFMFNFSKEQRAFHCNESNFNDDTHVKIRLLSDKTLPVKFSTGVLKTKT